MTGKQRLWAAIRGQAVDRVPVWVREGFDFHIPLPDADDFALGWQRHPAYESLWRFMKRHCDSIVGWAPGRHFNRYLGVPPHRIKREKKQVSVDVVQEWIHIDTPKGTLSTVEECHRGQEMMGWPVKTLVQDLKELEKLRSVPYEVDPVSYNGYERSKAQIGERGIMCLRMSSPWVVFSTCTTFTQALEWSVTHRELVHEILSGITEHFLNCLDVIFERSFEKMITNLGGSEQCTPPMMGPEAFEEFVKPYDSQIVEYLRQRGIPVNCHCHGRVAGALESMIDYGVCSTDPVEPPPEGDISIAAARQMVGDDLTLIGNLEWRELVEEKPETIRRRVREIIDTGKRRLVLSSSAGPVSLMPPQLIENYRAWIEEAIEYGVC